MNSETAMPLDWNHGALADGLRCYQDGEFFLAHEHWECAWLRAAEPDKTFLQSLIQIAAAMHHFERGNRTGAASLLARSLRRLEAFPSRYGGVELDPLRRSLRAWLLALDAQQSPHPPFPPIR